MLSVAFKVTAPLFSDMSRGIQDCLQKAMAFALDMPITRALVFSKVMQGRQLNLFLGHFLFVLRKPLSRRRET